MSPSVSIAVKLGAGNAATNFTATTPTPPMREYILIDGGTLAGQRLEIDGGTFAGQGLEPDN